MGGIFRFPENISTFQPPLLAFASVVSPSGSGSAFGPQATNAQHSALIMNCLEEPMSDSEVERHAIGAVV